MQLVPLFRNTTHTNRDDENRYLNYFLQVNISEGFYYSYTYDLTSSLQVNAMRKLRKTEAENFSDFYAHDFFVGKSQAEIQEHKPWENHMMWNYFLVRDFYDIVKRKKWVMPVIHGFVDFMNLEDAGNKFTVMLIARRSRNFAGTRYLRRGIN